MSAISIQLKEFSISVQSNGVEKILLHPLDAVVDSGSLFAILGSSGSGKTSLLNVIAGRYDKRSFLLSGHIDYTNQNLGNIGYVTQQDFLLPFLTVKETIKFAAELKIPSDNRERRATDLESGSQISSIDAVVDEAILDLGLRECSDNLIGDDTHAFGARGVSGGEKRRVSIACQIITNPQLLCADEPTSGLDSFTAVTVVESLRRIACTSSHSPFKRQQATVICSIHQPRSDVFHLFDSILLLSKGGFPVYCGPTSSMLAYFKKLGFECPIDSNPADFYVDISSVDLRSEKSREEGGKRVHYLADAYRLHVHKTSPCNEVPDRMASSISNWEEAGALSYECPWLRQVYLLARRFLLNNIRSGANVVGGILQAVLMGVVIMLIFFNLSDSLADIESRNGLIYLSISMECYILLIILVERYCTELKVFDRELQDRMYTSSAYLVAHILSSIPILVLQPVIYSVPIYYGCNLRHGGMYFFVFVAVQIAMSFVTNGLAWASVSLSRSFTVASLISNTNFTFITITSGFLVVTSDIPVYLRWVKNISYIQYAYRILMSNEFTDRTFSGCPSPNKSDCTQYIGNDILNTQNVDENEYKSITWLYLFTIWIAYYAVAFFFLHYLRFPVTGVVGGEGTSEDDSEFRTDVTAPIHSSGDNNEPEDVLLHTYKVCLPVVISVKHVSLYVNSSTSRNKESEKSFVAIADGSKKSPSYEHSNVALGKRILCEVSAEINPGRLVALMGGSGSGKTTLLNIIAGHVGAGCINNSPADSISVSNDGQYSGCGQVLFNNEACRGHDIQSTIAYVQQFDFHYPHLTVLETFEFHASLKFGRVLDKRSRRKKINRLVRVLGLSQCVHTRVGCEGMKGISGGECRRLTIGIQLLKDPSICILDEPTTGLDTFTARHIVETLQELAHQGGCTVILSIHQPRYDIFRLIDDVVLLSRGLQVWTGPTGHMLAHFESLGFPLPSFTNPADFILDVTSIDFRDISREEKSRAGLTTLVTAYYSTFSNFGMDDPKSVGVFSANEVNVSLCQSPRESFSIHTLGLLLRRSYLNQIRQPVLASTRVSQGLFFALILAAFYAPLGDDQNSIQNRIGLLYELTALCFIGMLSCIAIFPIERNVFYREYTDGGYSALSFFLAYFIIAIPVILLTGFCIAILVTHAIGAQPTWNALGVFTFVVSCFMLSGECIGVMFCAMFLHVGFSVNVMSIFIGITNQFTGFVSLSIPRWLDYFGYFSPAKWGSVVLTNVVFRGESFTCSNSEELFTGDCPLSTGQQVLELYNMQYSNELYQSQGNCLLILSIVTVLFFLGAFVTFRIKAYKLIH